MAEINSALEYWLRGPVTGVPDLMQPVAHALLQARKEIHELMKDFPETLLWKNPADLASTAFHLQHIPGVLDRLLTYASGKSLSMEQLKYLSEEGLEDNTIRISSLLQNLDDQIDKSIEYLKKIDISTLNEIRTVGRKQYASTVLGLVFHSAEHTMRHTGQLLVITRVLASSNN